MAAPGQERPDIMLASIVSISAIAAGGRAPVVGQQWGGLPTVEAMTSLTKNELMPQR